MVMPLLKLLELLHAKTISSCAIFLKWQALMLVCFAMCLLIDASKLDRVPFMCTCFNLQCQFLLSCPCRSHFQALIYYTFSFDKVFLPMTREYLTVLCGHFPYKLDEQMVTWWDRFVWWRAYSVMHHACASYGPRKWRYWNFTRERRFLKELI